MNELRSSEQNSLMWVLLTDIANQLEWPVDGRMQLLSPDDWKHILTAGLKRDQRVAAGVDGGFVILGQYTHKMTKAEMAEFLDFLLAFGTSKAIVWTTQGAENDH